MNPAAKYAVNSLKKEARSMMVERMRQRMAKKDKKGSDIPSDEDPDDELDPEGHGATVEDDGELGDGAEYPHDEDKDMDHDELPSIVIALGSKGSKSPIMPPKRGRGRPKKGY